MGVNLDLGTGIFQWCVNRDGNLDWAKIGIRNGRGMRQEPRQGQELARGPELEQEQGQARERDWN